MSSGKIIIFAGTNEGRRLCEAFEDRLDITVSVATEYGGDALFNVHRAQILSARLDEQQMEALFKEKNFALAVDATHPYALEVTANIKRTCERTGCEYLRLVRGGSLRKSGAVTVADTAGAVKYLNSAGENSNALITTGSKELALFCSVNNYRERLFVRVLPSADAIAQCRALGFYDSHIVAMQGPFSHALNRALLEQFRCKFLVSKDSGTPGGIAEKLSAAREAGAAVLLIERPEREEGCSYDEVAAILSERFLLKTAEKADSKAAFFPLFIRAADKRVLVVGGGRVAERRVAALLKFAFEVTVVSPQLSPALMQLYKNGGIAYRESAFCDADINGFEIVLAATNSRAVNAKVGQLAGAVGAYVSVADCAEECSFYFPAIAARGDITVGIVGNGRDHSAVKAAAKRIREGLKQC